MSTYAIRPATDDDRPGIRKVQVETWKIAYRGMLPDRVLSELTTENPPMQSKNPPAEIINSRRAFVAENAKTEIIGFAVGGISRDKKTGYDGELWAIYVLEKYQGNGTGKELFKTMLAELSKSYEKMIIWVLESNTKTHKFYEKMGGKRLNLKKDFLWKDEPVAPEVAYGWELG